MSKVTEGDTWTVVAEDIEQVIYQAECGWVSILKYWTQVPPNAHDSQLECVCEC